MKRIGILILCAALAFPCSAMAMTAEIGKVTAAEGRVDVTRAPDNEAVLLAQGAPVFVGDSIRAKDHSKAEIVFADKSVVKIAPNTRMEIKDFAVKGSARVHAEIHIARGKIFADVSKTGSPDTFIITTPNAKGSVRGTEVIVFYQSERTGALVKDGRLSISNVSLPGQKKELTGGEAVMVPFDAAPEKPRPYMDAEFALHEQDTRPAIFRAVSLGKGAGAMRGAITTLMGGVRILKKGGADWHYAKLNEFVEEGDKVETAEDGMTSLLFDNGNIVQVQPNSRIILSILKKDPKTGEFDNTFEVDSGKVKAVVEKLGKSSNFRVKTPTALCGVRGTIMYVNVAAGATQAFYEGGGGVVTNPVSGDTTFVESGQNAVSTDAGAISAPAATPADVKMTLDASYSYGVAQGEYAAPENSAADAKDGGTTVPGVDNTPDTQTSTGDGGGIVPPEVPFTVANPPPSQPPQPVSSIGNFYYSDAVGPCLSLGGSLYSISIPNNYPAAFSGSSAFTMTGNYAISTSNSLLIFTTDGLRSYDSATGMHTTSNGGAYYSMVGGSRDGTIITGYLYGLYIDPSGNGGVMSSSGSFSGVDAPTFTAGGSATFTQKAAAIDVNILPQDLYSHIRNEESFFGSGSRVLLDGSVTANLPGGTSISIASVPLFQDWGVWGVAIAGKYQNPSSPWGAFDLSVTGLSKDSSGKVEGSWLQRASVSSWSGNNIVCSLQSANIVVHEDGRIFGGDSSGSGRGNYVDVPVGQTGAWQLAAVGEWNDRAVAMDMINFIANGNSFRADLTALNPGVPITEITGGAATQLSSVAPSGMISSAVMDMRMYETTVNPAMTMNNGIWAATISGFYSGAGPTGGSWDITVSGAADSATITGTQWSGGYWRADVSGTVDAKTITGAAAGTVDSPAPGQFSGSAVGEWTT